MTRVLVGLRTVVLGAAAVAALAVIAGVLLGWRPVLLVSGSMAPWAEAGSVVVAAPVDGSQVEVGDVITARPRGGAALPVTHRVVAVEEQDGVRVARTRGDANAEVDLAPVALDGATLLEARFVVDGAGFLLGRDPSRLLAGAAVALVGLLGLWWVWTPPPAPRSARVASLAAGRPTRSRPGSPTG